eukprot:s2358_g15.t1
MQVPEQQKATEGNRRQQKATEGKSASQKSLFGLKNWKQQFLQVLLLAILTPNPPTLAVKSLVEYLTFAFARIWLSWLYLLDFKANSFGEPS